MILVSDKKCVIYLFIYKTVDKIVKIQLTNKTEENFATQTNINNRSCFFFFFVLETFKIISKGNVFETIKQRVNKL